MTDAATPNDQTPNSATPGALTPDDKTVLAGELALGLLEGEDKATALRLMLRDRAFAENVERWRADTGGLFDAVDPVAPPAGHWDGIARGINAPAPAVAQRQSGFWRGTAFVSMAAAAALAAIIVWPVVQPATPIPPAASQFAVAQLSGPIAGLRIAARYDPATAQLRVRATGMPDTPTAPELWIVPADGVPRSLGQIRRDGDTMILVAQGHRMLINAAAQLHLSMEPPSPVPHPRPSSDVVARGSIDMI